LTATTPADASFGLYLHIPVCASRCIYCDFHTEARAATPWPALTAALRQELGARVPLFAGLTLRSIYFGGGTPSLAPVELFAAVIGAARAVLPTGAACEITVEANPQDLTGAWLAALRQLGVNRLSLGWQSAREETLRLLGRRHTAAEARAAVALARRAGFDNLSLDLIFAIPGQTPADVEAEVAAALALAPEHLSLYALTYHAGTELDRRRQAGAVTPASEDDEAEMMERIEAALVRVGFEHYEVSNYARAGRRAVHNSLYWAGSRYLGIGPGAHSFWHENWQRGWRWESVRGLERYLETWAEPHPPGLPEAEAAAVAWREELTPRQLLAERMLCGLRTSDGVDTTEPALAGFPAEVAEGAISAEALGWLQRDGTRLRPTSLGLMHADAAAALFF
jgi:oxygen-independent coproporphyrinogen-3 oxidase